MTDECFEALKPVFQKYVDNLKSMTDAGLPERKGLYVLSENGQTLYVGISGNLRRRWQMHRFGDASASSFAVKLVRELKEEWKASYKEASGLKALQRNADFRGAFKAQQARIRKMDLRYCEWNDGDDDDLAVLEMYAARARGTKYNDFSTH